MPWQSYDPNDPANQTKRGLGLVGPKPNLLADIGNVVKSGAAGAAADIFEGTHQAIGLGSTPRDYLRDVQQGTIDKLSPESQRDMQNTGFEGNNFSDLHLKQGSTLRGAALQVAQGVGSMAPTMLGGGLAGRAVGLATKGLLGARTGYGAVGGMQIGGASADQARHEVEGLTEDQLMRDPRFADLIHKAYPPDVYPDPGPQGFIKPGRDRAPGLGVFSIDKVKDGDTPVSGGKDLRVLHIDAPETAHGNKPGQPYGEQAKEELRKAIGDAEFAKVYGKDKFGRELVDLGGLSKDLTEKGAAWASRWFMKDPSYLDAEAKARAEGKGLWADKAPQAPWLFKHPEGYDTAEERKRVAGVIRQEASERLAHEAFKGGALVGAASMGALGPAMERVLTHGSGSVLKTALMGGLNEKAQEFVESGGQQLAVNRALQPLDDRPMMQDVAGQAVTGAALGFGTGAMSGLGAGLIHKGASMLRNPETGNIDVVEPSEAPPEVATPPTQAETLQQKLGTSTRAQRDQLEQGSQIPADLLRMDEQEPAVVNQETVVKTSAGPALDLVQAEQQQKPEANVHATATGEPEEDFNRLLRSVRGADAVSTAHLLSQRPEQKTVTAPENIVAADNGEKAVSLTRAEQQEEPQTNEITTPGTRSANDGGTPLAAEDGTPGAEKPRWDNPRFNAPGEAALLRRPDSPPVDDLRAPTDGDAARNVQPAAGQPDVSEDAGLRLAGRDESGFGRAGQPDVSEDAGLRLAGRDVKVELLDQNLDPLRRQVDETRKVGEETDEPTDWNKYEAARDKYRGALSDALSRYETAAPEKVAELRRNMANVAPDDTSPVAFDTARQFIKDFESRQDDLFTPLTSEKQNARLQETQQEPTSETRPLTREEIDDEATNQNGNGDLLRQDAGLAGRDAGDTGGRSGGDASAASQGETGRDGDAHQAIRQDGQGQVGPAAQASQGQEVSPTSTSKPLGDRIASLNSKNPHFPKDVEKARRATQFIGEGVQGSHTEDYRQLAGDLANTGNYTADDHVFVSVNGKRRGAVQPVRNGELTGAYQNVAKAMQAGATIITGDANNRIRDFNSGERALSTYLNTNGYKEAEPGTWKPDAAAKLYNKESDNTEAKRVETLQGLMDRSSRDDAVDMRPEFTPKTPVGLTSEKYAQTAENRKNPYSLIRDGSEGNTFYAARSDAPNSLLRRTDVPAFKKEKPFPAVNAGVAPLTDEARLEDAQTISQETGLFGHQDRVDEGKPATEGQDGERGDVDGVVDTIPERSWLNAKGAPLTGGAKLRANVDTYQAKADGSPEDGTIKKAMILSARGKLDSKVTFNVKRDDRGAAYYVDNTEYTLEPKGDGVYEIGPAGKDPTHELVRATENGRYAIRVLNRDVTPAEGVSDALVMSHIKTAQQRANKATRDSKSTIELGGVKYDNAQILALGRAMAGDEKGTERNSNEQVREDYLNGLSKVATTLGVDMKDAQVTPDLTITSPNQGSRTLGSTETKKGSGKMATRAAEAVMEHFAREGNSRDHLASKLEELRQLDRLAEGELLTVQEYSKNGKTVKSGQYASELVAKTQQQMQKAARSGEGMEKALETAKKRAKFARMDLSNTHRYIDPNTGALNEGEAADLYNNIADPEVKQRYGEALTRQGVDYQDTSEGGQKELLAQGRSETEMFGDREGETRITTELESAKSDEKFTAAKTQVKDQNVGYKAPETVVARGELAGSPTEKFTKELLDKLGLKTQVHLADSKGLEDMLGEMRGKVQQLAAQAKRNRESGKKSSQALNKEIANQIKELKDKADILQRLDPKVPHFIALDSTKNKQLIVYLPKVKNKAQHVRNLAHELGHYIQRTALDELIHQTDSFVNEGSSRMEREQQMTRREVINGVFGLPAGANFRSLTDAERQAAEERFAENMMRWVHEQAEPKNLVEQFFKGVVDKLREMWRSIKSTFKPNTQEFRSFDAFMEGLMARTGALPKTELGKKYAEVIRPLSMGLQPRQRKDFIVQDLNPLQVQAEVQRYVGLGLDAVTKTMHALGPLAAPVESQLWMMQSPRGGQSTFAKWLSQSIKRRVGDTTDTPIHLEGLVGRMEGGRFQAFVHPDQKTVTFGSTEGLFEKQRRMAAQAERPLARILDKLPDMGGVFTSKAKKEAARAEMAAIQDTLLMEKPAGNNPTVLAIRDYLKRLRVMASNNGMDVKERQNYFPHMINRAAWDSKREEVIQKIMAQVDSRTGTTIPRDQAEILHAMVAYADGELFSLENIGPDDGVFIQTIAPGFKSHHARMFTQELMRELVGIGVYEKDVAVVLNRYTHALVKRAAFEQQYGGWRSRFNPETGEEAAFYDPAAKLNLALIKGLTEDYDLGYNDYRRITDVLMPAVLGRLGARSMNPLARTIQNYTLMGFNWALLPLATLSSVPEIGGIDVRAGKLGEGLKQFFKLTADKHGRQMMFELAHDIGLMRDAMTEHVLSAAVEGEFINPFVQKWNNRLFHWNGLHLFTNMTRAAALASAKQAIPRYAEAAARGDAEAKRQMQELGVSVDDVRRWVGDTDGWNNPALHPRVMTALSRWVDGAILRPDAMNRTAWASDPRFQMISYLKGFMWAFYSTIQRRVGVQTARNSGLMKAVPTMLLGAALLPLAMGAYELRKWLTQDLPSGLTGIPVRTRQKEGLDYAKEVFDRSGIAGPMQLVFNMWGSAEHNELVIAPLLGAPIGKLLDTASHDFEYMLAHTLPGAAQSSVIRELMFGED